MMDIRTLKQLKLLVMIVDIIHARPAECRLCISWVLWVTSGQGTEEVTSELALFGLSQCHHSNDPNIPKNLNL